MPAAPLDRRGLETLVLRFCEAFNRDDLDAVMEYFAEDALYETFEGRLCRGKEEIRAAFEPQFRGDFGRILWPAVRLVWAGRAPLLRRAAEGEAHVRPGQAAAGASRGAMRPALSGASNG